MARLAYYFDSSKCVGCRGCQVTCKQWNEEKRHKTGFAGTYQNPPALGADTRMVIKYYENFEKDNVPSLNFLKYQCFHCGDPACVKVCPSGALAKTEFGAVSVDKEKCIACGYCRNSCPFHIPAVSDTVNKCDMCHSRIENGSAKDKTSIPACVKSCVAGALEFGEHAALVAKARKRAEWLRSRGYAQANVYGDEVLGGLGIISVLKYPPESYGLPARPTVPAEVVVWKDFFNPLGLIMLGGAIGASVLHRLAQRPKNDAHHPADPGPGKEDAKV